MTSTYRRPSALRAFFKSGSAGGLILMGVAALALVVANSPLAEAYFATLHDGNVELVPASQMCPCS